MDGLIRQLFRLCSAVVGFIVEKCWTEPVRSRGAAWVFCFWVHVACGFYFGDIIVRSGRPYLVALLIYYATAFYMATKLKPKRLGRNLRYRRHR